MKRIQYDNFRTQVDYVDSPVGKMHVLRITDHDDSTIHEFAYRHEDALKVGAALQGSAVVTAPAGALHNLKPA